jgi:predicted metal-dependent HD superfamily phosphohydrolase
VSTFERHWPRRLASHADLRDRVLAAYAAPHRHYHDRRHLAEVLDAVATLVAATPGAEPHREAVVLAAWFHDVVYDGRPDDEERSARLAARSLRAAGVPTALADEVARLVLVTKDHRPAEDDLAGRLLSDADLAILASEPTRYEEYAAAVREEYAFLDEATFRTGRTRVLQGLLDGPVFATDEARSRWEDRARGNVTAELRRLRAPAAP